MILLVHLFSSYSSVNEGLSYGAIAFGSSDRLNYQLNVSKRDYNDYDAPSFLRKIIMEVETVPAREIVENSHSDSESMGLELPIC